MWFPWSWSPPFHLRASILNLKSGEALSGVVWQMRGPWFTLKKAALLKGGQPPTPMDGDVIVHRDNIDFVQVPD